LSYWGTIYEQQREGPLRGTLEGEMVAEAIRLRLEGELLPLSGRKFFDAKTCTVYREWRGRLLVYMNPELTKKMLSLLRRYGPRMPRGFFPALSKITGYKESSLRTWVCVVREVVKRGYLRHYIKYTNAKSVEVPEVKPVRFKGKSGGGRKAIERPFCAYYRACKYQSNKVVSYTLGNPKVLHIPYCLWPGLCNMQELNLAEVAGRRASLCKRYGLKFCKKCLEFHL